MNQALDLEKPFEAVDSTVKSVRLIAKDLTGTSPLAFAALIHSNGRDHREELWQVDRFGRKEPSGKPVVRNVAVSSTTYAAIYSTGAVGPSQEDPNQVAAIGSEWFTLGKVIAIQVTTVYGEEITVTFLRKKPEAAV